MLPGLEEGSDHYTRTNNLLEAVAEAVSPHLFYSSLWECVATNATIRLPALTFVLSHIVRAGRGQQAVGGIEQQLHLLGTDIEVMCRALCLALRDTSALVQRAALDLLLLGFPVHQPQFVVGAMVGLVTSVLSTLLRRDMSLNRRLFSWLLGTEINPSLLPTTHPLVRTDQNSGYFLTYSVDLVVNAVVLVMEQAIPLPGSQKVLDLKPYRIITTLLDKAEIGPLIIDKIMLDIFRTLYHMSNYQQENPTNTSQELIKTANLLFAQLETNHVWTCCGEQFSLACRQLEEEQGGGEDVSFLGGEVGGIGSGCPTLPEMCKLIIFLLEVVSIETYVETSAEHLPSLFQVMVRSLTSCLGTIGGQSLTECINTIRKVLARIQPAWNVWDVTEKITKKTVVELEVMDVAKEVTESHPGSPLSELSVVTPDNEDVDGAAIADKSGKTFHNYILPYLLYLESPRRSYSSMAIDPMLNTPWSRSKGFYLQNVFHMMLLLKLNEFIRIKFMDFMDS